MQERRRRTRHHVYLAAELVVSGASPHTAITKDISELGLLLLTRAKLSLKQDVNLRIYLPGSEEVRSTVVSGRVVRCERLTTDEKGIWRDKVAFSFSESQPALAQEFEALAAEQAKVYGFS